jgi:hypothetical protein
MYVYIYIIKTMLSIEIVNKILVNICELNNGVIITQYHPITNTKYYKINFHSDLLCRIQAVLRMKQLYPILYSDFTNKGNINLYKHGTEHYEKQFRLDKN